MEREAAIPECLEFEIGGYDCAGVVVRWRHGCLQYGDYAAGFRPELISLRSVVPDRWAWGAFWTDVHNTGVWYWRTQYEPRIQVLDGPEWHLRLQSGDRRVASRGASAYPPDGRDHPSEAFRQFMRALGRLASDEEFVRRWYDGWA